MTARISTLGLQQSNIKNLTSGTAKLNTLNTQLATGVYSSSLLDYSSSDTQKLINLNTAVDKRNAYLNVINTVSTRVTAYDEALSGLEDVASEVSSSVTSAGTYNSETNEALATTIQTYMSQVTYYLNQEVSGRYLFSGSRYDTEPVVDITTLPVPPSDDETVTTNDLLPAYDTDYDSENPYVPNSDAYDQDTVSIDTNQDLNYGITSTESGFQELVLGLRWAYAATQDPDNYEAYMEKAQTLITQGTTDIQAIHTGLTGASTTLDQTETLHNDMIDSLTSQIDNIESVDTNEVSVKITTYEAQLEASYSATAKIIGLSIVDYL